MSAPIALDDLRLDLQNPRLGRRVKTQTEALRAMVTRQKGKLLRLAEHIAAHGLNPAEPFLVIDQRGTSIVLDGNRRLAALLLLADPSKARGTELERGFAQMAAANPPPASDVECAVVASRAIARPWILLRHGGEQGGLALVRWGTAERERFEPSPKGTQAAAAVNFIDSARDAYPDDPSLQANLDVVEEKRLTTLGRFVNLKEGRESLQLDKDGALRSDAVDDVAELVARVVDDFAHGKTVTAIHGKDDRESYVETLNKPKAEPDPTPEDPPTPAKATPRARTPREPKPGPLLRTLTLPTFSPRISKVLTEVRKLSPETHPNAVGIMLRVLVELVVDDFYGKRNWTIGHTEFRNRLKKCLREIDPTEKDHAWQQLRGGLNDGTSLHSINTLHAYVHSPSYHAIAGDVRALADMYEPFLKALNDLG